MTDAEPESEVEVEPETDSAPESVPTSASASVSPEDRLRALLAVDVDEVEPAKRRRPAADPATEESAEPRRRPLSWLSGLTLLVLVALGCALILAGIQVVRTSTEGELFAPVTDPAAPGFEAVVDPTPTLAVLQESDGTFVAATVLTLPDASNGGGGVLLVPKRTLTEIPGVGSVPIELVYETEGARDAADVIGDVLGVAMREVAVVDDARWTGLVDPVAPIVVDNTDPLEIDGEVAFPVGEISLGAADVAPYLTARVPGESDLARMFRHQLFWRAWLDAVADAGGGDAVPGEVESGLGRFVRTLSDGRAEITVVPVEELPSPDGLIPPTFQPDEDGIAELITRFVPLPRTPRPGVRPRVRLLNGTSDVTEAAELARVLPAAGVEVVVIGNAASLDQEETTIAYVGAQHRDAAEALRDLLGVGVVVEEVRASDVADITVTLGADHD